MPILTNNPNLDQFLDDDYQSKEYVARERSYKPLKTTTITYGSKTYNVLNILL